LEDVSGLIKSLQTATLADAHRQKPVIESLNTVTAIDEETVLKQSKAIFAQQQWTVQGNVYQSAGNINIYNAPSTSSGPEKAKPLVERWQAWVALIVGLLTAVTLAIKLPKELESTPATSETKSVTKPADPEKPTPQLLIGSIRNETNDPLPGVQVSLPRFNLTKTTDSLGQFQFEVTASGQETVALLAQKLGYKTYEADVTLGNTSLGFAMRKKP
jgi:CarboxypepD_reg-like domain